MRWACRRCTQTHLELAMTRLVASLVVFALSWFPLNVLNLILDIYDIFQVL